MGLQEDSPAQSFLLDLYEAITRSFVVIFPSLVKRRVHAIVKPLEPWEGPSKT